jgi:hypothetical protein
MRMAARDHVWLFWEWNEDAYLAKDFLMRSKQLGLRVCAFGIEDLPALESLKKTPPLVLWDRAGDVYDSARNLSDWAEALGSRVINPPRGMLLARDKGVLHKLLEQRCLPVPHTTFLKDNSSLQEISPSVGKYLVLKPVRSGGGEGVQIREWCEKCIIEAMRSRPGETWLLQEYIEAAELHGRRAWFRVFFLMGDVRICWWDNRTHIYEFIPCDEVDRMGLSELRDLGLRIGSTFPLHFFSTEIAYRPDGRPVIVDYVNDPCDLRSKARIPNGVPPELLDWIFEKIFAVARSLEA